MEDANCELRKIERAEIKIVVPTELGVLERFKRTRKWKPKLIKDASTGQYVEDLRYKLALLSLA